VDHDASAKAGHGSEQRVALEDVSEHRLGTDVSQPVDLLRGAGHPCHVVAIFDEQWHEVAADHTACTCHEDPH